MNADNDHYPEPEVERWPRAVSYTIVAVLCLLTWLGFICFVHLLWNSEIVIGV